MKWKIFILVLIGSASAVAAADAPKPELISKAGTTDPAPAASTQPAERSPVSANTTARLTESLPKFTPSPRIAVPRPGEPAISEPQESEGPRSPAVLLPQYDVFEEKLPSFRDRELLTREGRAEVAVKRHPGLRFGPLAFLNVRRGLEMLAEEEDIDRRQEMMELVSFARAIERTLPADPATGERSPLKAAAE